MPEETKELTADELFTAKAMAFSLMTVSGTVIVVPNSRIKRVVLANLEGEHRITHVVIPVISQLMGWSSQIIVVHPDVDLTANIQGEGRLINLLKHRTRAFENTMITIL